MKIESVEVNGFVLSEMDGQMVFDHLHTCHEYYIASTDVDTNIRIMYGHEEEVEDIVKEEQVRIQVGYSILTKYLIDWCHKFAPVFN